MNFGRLYRSVPALLMARRNLSRTKMRSLLAALGIVIGVVAIASLGMFGSALQYSVTNSFGDIGNQVIVTPSAESGQQHLTGRDVRRIRQAAAGTEVAPTKNVGLPVSFGREAPQLRSVTGMQDPSVVYGAESGRIPSSLRGGVLVGSALAEEHDLAPGRSVTVNGTNMQIRAVVGANSNPLLSTETAIVVPPSMIGGSGYDRVMVVADTGHEANETAMAIRSSMNDREKRVNVQELSTLLEQIDQLFATLNTFLLGIASISLLVAGISILNVMLMSTIERREEIGVLRAVGYQKRDVLKVMLSEAAMLGLVGGVIGVGFSVIAGLIIHWALVDDALAAFRLPNLFYLSVAFGFAIVTAILSGLYPAWKAASEEPVEALRS